MKLIRMLATLAMYACIAFAGTEKSTEMTPSNSKLAFIEGDKLTIWEIPMVPKVEYELDEVEQGKDIVDILYDLERRQPDLCICDDGEPCDCENVGISEVDEYLDIYDLDEDHKEELEDFMQKAIDNWGVIPEDFEERIDKYLVDNALFSQHGREPSRVGHGQGVQRLCVRCKRMPVQRRNRLRRRRRRRRRISRQSRRVSSRLLWLSGRCSDRR